MERTVCKRTTLTSNTPKIIPLHYLSPASFLGGTANGKFSVSVQRLGLTLWKNASD